MQTLDKIGLLKAIKKSIALRRPLAVVRVGDGENIVLAQYTILSRKEFMATSIGSRWPTHGSGIKLPNPKARDELITSLRNAHIIGILPYEDNRIKAPRRYKRTLTDRVFKIYKIRPVHTFDAHLTRTILSDQRFWKTLENQRIILISKWGEQFIRISKPLLQKHRITVITSLSIKKYEDYPQVLKKVRKYSFDVALIGAGVGALPLASYIAKHQNVVALDMGKAFELVVIKKGKPLPKVAKK